MGLEDSVERIRAALIKKMSGKVYLRPGGLVEGLATDTGESPLTTRQSLGRLSKERWIEGVSPDGAPFAQVRIIGSLPMVPQDADRQRWISVLERSGIPLQDRESLALLSAKLAAFSESDMGFILQGLISLRENQASETDRHRFLVSARYLLGSSKLLDELADTPRKTPPARDQAGCGYKLRKCLPVPRRQPWERPQPDWQRHSAQIHLALP
jgi:hypothetical protein